MVLDVAPVFVLVSWEELRMACWEEVENLCNDTSDLLLLTLEGERSGELTPG